MRRGREEGGPRVGFTRDKDKDAERLVGEDCTIARDADRATTEPKQGEVRGQTMSSLFGG